MDPLSALSIATGIVTFVDFGAKLVSLSLEIKKSDEGRPAALSALMVESRDLSGHATHARNKIASLQVRYPRQSESLTRLDAECVQAEKDLQKLADSLTVQPGAGGHHGLRARGALALVSLRGTLKQGDIESLERRLRSIREQMMMSVIMCIADDATESRAKLKNINNGVEEVLDVLRPITLAIDELQPEFHTVSRSRPLETDLEREKMASGLWTSITTANMDMDVDQANSHCPPPTPERPLEDDSHIHSRILEGLDFEDMISRESQIENPFPETFQWLLDTRGAAESDEPSSSPRLSPKFKEWLESQANETPFWVTGNPASGKSTLMKFISANPQVKTHLQVWSGEFQLLTCNVYFWNPGSSGQKTQIGLLSTILRQLLSQRPDLCRRVAPRRYLYFQLAGSDSPDPPDWSLEELRDSVTRFVSQIKDTNRFALFVDGLDEYEGNLDRLISFLKRLHHDYNVKLCVSSRPWNTFKDEFHAYPSLRMELLTKPDIVKYVCSRIGGSLAFNELRKLYPTSVENLESQIIEKADGVFLWVVLVVENVIATARENNDLREIWRVFESMPPGLEELYGSMRRRLDSTHRERASRMYQLLFRWNEVLDRPFETLEFWMAINCRDPTEPQSHPEAGPAGIRPALERRLAGATGGILQIHTDPARQGSNARASVGFLHRTVFDWLQGMKSSIENDGPTDFDPGLVLTSVLVSRVNTFYEETDIDGKTVGIDDAFAAGQSCRPSPEARSKLLRIIDRVQLRHCDGQSLRSSYLDTMETEILSSYPDSTVRSFLATRHLCAPYLQAKLESSSGVTGLELPQKLHLLPRAFWKSSRKRLVSLIITALVDVNQQLQRERLQILNRRLRTFEALLQAQSPFTTLGSLRTVVKKMAEYGRPREFWDSLKAGVEGKGFAELTSISNLGQEELLYVV